MSTRDDAIFLAGFITGTYDLKGESLPPACVQRVIERVMEPAGRATTPTPALSPHIAADNVTLENTVRMVRSVVAASQAENADAPAPLPEEPSPKAGRKLSPEEAVRRSQRMKDMWARKRAEKEFESSIPAVTSIVMTPPEPGNSLAPSAGGA